MHDIAEIEPAALFVLWQKKKKQIYNKKGAKLEV